MQAFTPRLNSVAAVCAAIVLMFFSLTVPLARKHARGASECALEMTSLKPGAKVRADALVTGTAKIPVDGYLWILAHKKGLRKWWPQGQGETVVKEGRWETLVVFGKSGEIGTFEVAAVVVDKQANEDLNKWVKDSQSSGFEPTDFPNPITGCTPLIVPVDKVGD